MSAPGAPARGLLVALGVLLAATVHAGADEVPYVQTPQPVVEAMLDLAGVQPTDFVVDLGSGDGRIVITAARRHGARGLGIDYDPYLLEQSRANAERAGVADRVRFVKADFFAADLSAATVVTLYLLPDFNLRLRPKLLADLRAGARIVSHDWDMGEWAPDVRIELPAPGKTVGLREVSTVYLWIVPARLAGRWATRVPIGGGTTDVELAFEQQFATLGGVARVHGAERPLEAPIVKGRYLAFRIDDPGGAIGFQGEAGPDRIVGQVATPDGRRHPWHALRVK